MTRICDILAALEEIAPSRFAFSFDHVGLQIGDTDAEVVRAAVSLDRSLAAAKFAVESKCQLLLTHHPLIWEPLATITSDNLVGQTVLTLSRNGVSFIAAHTNWDCAQGGINDTLAAKLGLNDVRSVGAAAAIKQLKLVVFVPSESSQKVIDAASAAGAGVIGLYTRCAFEAAGTGTFIGGECSNPTVGSAGSVERVAETRVEMTVPAPLRQEVECAVRFVHPYEEPAIDFVELADAYEQPICRIGALSDVCSLARFSERVDAALNTRCWAWGEPARQIRKVAICGGSADDEWSHAAASGADVLVTGEVKQHVALEASESGFAVIAAGHYATEHPGCVALAESMRLNVPATEWIVFEPRPGEAGRPN